MCLLLDHGLRCGEVALLTVEAFSLKEGAFTFYRPKVDRVQTHRMYGSVPSTPQLISHIVTTVENIMLI